MIDMHHHLVYGYDDGARKPEDSYAMLECAVNEGVDEIVCTSHYRAGKSRDVYFRHFDKLEEYIAEKQIPIKLREGAEIMFTAECLSRGELPTIAGTSFVLVEFLPDIPYMFLGSALKNLNNAGYRPILAHFERYICLREGERPAEIHNYCKMQMNADTVLKAKGLFGNRWVKHALDETDIVAPDAHNSTSRRCRLGEAYDVLCKLRGESFAEKLCHKTPRRILKQK